jgi:hypothetical protein
MVHACQVKFDRPLTWTPQIQSPGPLTGTRSNYSHSQTRSPSLHEQAVELLQNNEQLQQKDVQNRQLTAELQQKDAELNSTQEKFQVAILLRLSVITPLNLSQTLNHPPPPPVKLATRTIHMHSIKLLALTQSTWTVRQIQSHEFHAHVYRLPHLMHKLIDNISGDSYIIYDKLHIKWVKLDHPLLRTLSTI